MDAIKSIESTLRKNEIKQTPLFDITTVKNVCFVKIGVSYRTSRVSVWDPREKRKKKKYLQIKQLLSVRWKMWFAAFKIKDLFLGQNQSDDETPFITKTSKSSCVHSARKYPCCCSCSNSDGTPPLGANANMPTRASSHHPGDGEVLLVMGSEWKCADTGSRAADGSNVTEMK